MIWQQVPGGCASYKRRHQLPQLKAMPNDYAADYLDDMSDRAYEIEEAMREAEQSDFSYIETMEESDD